MPRVERLSGEGCAFYVRSRCTHAQSPEQSGQARCSLLEARRKVGAETLDRLERIKRLGDPGDREVARRHVIQKNLQAMTRITCQGYVPAGGEGPLCIHQHLVYCLLLMPRCQGRCEQFLVQRDPGSRAGGENAS